MQYRISKTRRVDETEVVTITKQHQDPEEISFPAKKGAVTVRLRDPFTRKMGTFTVNAGRTRVTFTPDETEPVHRGPKSVRWHPAVRYFEGDQ